LPAGSVCVCVCVFYSGVLLVLLALVVVGSLLDMRHERSASMKWDLLYHVSTNVRHLVGSRDGHMTWTTVDESTSSRDPDSQISDGQTADDMERPPNARLLVDAFSYKPGLIRRD